MSKVLTDPDVRAQVGAPKRRDQLAVLLPGEGAPDRNLIDRAVEELNRMYDSAALETACNMGEYVLERFFKGDLRRFHERSHDHVSFRRLAARSDLHVSAAFLWSAVAVVEQIRQLPTTVARQLPLSHHRLLLPVKDRKAKARMATRAVSEGLSKRQLAEEVRQHRLSVGSDHRAGRPPIPNLIKRLHQFQQSAQELVALQDQDFVVHRQFLAEARELIPEVTDLLAKAEEKLAALRKRLLPRHS